MRFYVCRNVAILAELSEVEAILQAYDLQAEGLEAHGYHVFREDGEISIAVIDNNGTIAWAEPVQAPASASERHAFAFLATHGAPLH